MNPANPTRRRSLATAQTVKEPTAALVSLAAQTEAAKKAAKKATRKYESLRKELLGKMREESFRQFTTQATIGGAAQTLEVTVGASSRNGISVAKLRENTTDAIFMECVSAAVGRVEDIAGKSVAALCTVTLVGEENVSTKILKPTKA